MSRIDAIFALTVETLGDEEKAKRWLRKPLRQFGDRTRQFGDRTPMEMLATDLGAHQVEVLLGRLSHGLAA